MPGGMRYWAWMTDDARSGDRIDASCTGVLLFAGVPVGYTVYKLASLFLLGPLRVDIPASEYAPDWFIEPLEGYCGVSNWLAERNSLLSGVYMVSEVGPGDTVNIFRLPDLGCPPVGEDCV